MAIRIALLTAALFASAVGHDDALAKASQFEDALDILDEAVSDISPEDEGLARLLSENSNETSTTTTTTTTTTVETTVTLPTVPDDQKISTAIDVTVGSSSDACAVDSDEGKEGICNQLESSSGGAATGCNVDTVEPREDGSALTCSRRLKGRSLSAPVYSVFIEATLTYANAAAATTAASTLSTALEDGSSFAASLATALSDAGLSVTVMNITVESSPAPGTTTAAPTSGGGDATTTATATATATLPGSSDGGGAFRQASVSTGLCALAMALFLAKQL